MKLSMLCNKLVFSFFPVFLLPLIANAQPLFWAFSRESYFVSSGSHDGLTGLTVESPVAFRDVLQVPGAPWLRLQFQAHNIIGKGEYQ